MSVMGHVWTYMDPAITMTGSGATGFLMPPENSSPASPDGFVRASTSTARLVCGSLGYPDAATASTAQAFRYAREIGRTRISSPNRVTWARCAAGSLKRDRLIIVFLRCRSSRVGDDDGPNLA
jgi:hypothetical protein